MTKRAQKPSILTTRMAGNILIFLLLIVLTFWWIFRDQDPAEIVAVTKTASASFLLLGLLCMTAYFLVESWNIRSILKTFGTKISLLKAFKFTIIGFFFCSVTPGASGGQPMEIYYMTKEGITAAHATIAIMLQTTGVQVAVMFFGLLCALLAPLLGLPALSGPVFWLFLLGLLINGVALAVLLVCLFSERTTKKLIKFVIKLLKKFHVKNLPEKEKSLNASLATYHTSAAYIKKHRSAFYACLARTILQFALFYLIPFCVYKAFHLSEYSAVQLFTTQSILFVATSGIPIPGSIGLSETVFLSLYGAVFGVELLHSATLLNRGINFYWFVIIGLFVTLINALSVHSPASPRKKSHATEKTKS